MTALRRILELLATQDKVYVAFTKLRPGVYQVAANDGDDVHASGVGITLEQACDCFVQSALHVGLMCEPCPRTEPTTQESTNG